MVVKVKQNILMTFAIKVQIWRVRVRRKKVGLAISDGGGMLFIVH